MPSKTITKPKKGAKNAKKAPKTNRKPKSKSGGNINIDRIITNNSHFIQLA